MVLLLSEACLIASAIAVAEASGQRPGVIDDAWEATEVIGSHNRYRVMTACWSEAVEAVAGFLGDQMVSKKTVPLGFPTVIDVTLASRYANETFDSLGSDDVVEIETEPDARPNHLAMDGFKFLMSSSTAKNDSVWPPYGIKCRCRAKRSSGDPSGRKPRGGGNDAGFEGGPIHPYSPDHAKAWTASVGMDYHGQRALADLGDGYVDMHAFRASENDSKKYAADRSTWFDKDLTYVKKYFGPAPDGMSDAEYQSVSWYTTGYGYRPVNDALRSGTPAVRLAMANTVKVTSSGIAKYDKYVGVAYRGTILEKSLLDQYVVGAKLAEPSVLSTSRSRDIAESFTSWARQGGNPVLYKIHSKSGRDISSISEFEDEKEVAFLPGTGFKVVSIERPEDPDEPVIIELEELE